MNDGSLITGCTSTESGGGIFLESTNQSIQSTFTMNGGMIAECGAGNGGALYVHGYAYANLRGGIIDMCTAENNGGGVYVYGDSNQATLSLSGVRIQTCEALNGGGIYAYNDSSVTIESSTVIDTCTASSTDMG
jgi:hypothetical protein